jgi:putative NADPH-quinone reductase
VGDVVTRAMVVLAHPRSHSFNHAVAERAAAALEDAGIDVVVHDLSTEAFDPVLRAGEAYTSGQSAAAVLAASDDPVL